LKQAQSCRPRTKPGRVNLIKEGKAQVYAQNRYMLLGLATIFPARAAGEPLLGARMSIALPKGPGGARLRQRIRPAVEETETVRGDDFP